MMGYAALGSDDGGSEGPDDACENEDPQAINAANISGHDRAEDVAAGYPSGRESWGEPSSEAPDADNWANFGPGNHMLPLPPPSIPQPSTLNAPLSDDSVALIRETMLQVSPVAPDWAKNLTDDALHRMVEKELKRTAEMNSVLSSS